MRIKFFLDGNQKLLKCKDCNLIFRLRLKTINEEINYDEDRISTQHEQNLLNEVDSRKDYKEFVLNCAKQYLHSPKEFLDIGSSVGSFLIIVDKVFPGTKLIGVEPSKPEVEIGKGLFNKIQFVNSYYDKDMFEKGRFDIVHHSHVIEHIIDPRKFIETNHFHLKKNGLLMLSYPSALTFSFIIDYLTKRSPGHVIQEQHFNYFSPTSIRNLLEKSGFEILNELYGLSYLKRNRLI